MNAQDTKRFLQTYLEAVNADLDDALERYVADDSLREHARFFQSAFPGYRIEPIDVIVEGNKIAMYATFHGVHHGPLMDIPPTGKEVSAPFVMIYILEEEKIVGHHFVTNELGLLQQLGVAPTATPARG